MRPNTMFYEFKYMGLRNEHENISDIVLCLNIFIISEKVRPPGQSNRDIIFQAYVWPPNLILTKQKLWMYYFRVNMGHHHHDVQSSPISRSKTKNIDGPHEGAQYSKFKITLRPGNKRESGNLSTIELDLRRSTPNWNMIEWSSVGNFIPCASEVTSFASTTNIELFQLHYYTIKSISNIDGPPNVLP